MAYSLTNLDDRTAQQLVDWAKRELIPKHCPEWTNHNVSDPGIALIEVFAAMTEMLLYRVNQIPDRLQLQLMELIGIRRKGPQAATVPVTFYLSAAQQADLTVESGIEVATARSTTSVEVVFTTAEALVIRPPQVRAMLTEDASRVGVDRWARHGLGSQGQLVREIALFPDDSHQGYAPANGDAFYVALEADPSRQVLYMWVDCQQKAAPAGLDPSDPPIQWQAWCVGSDGTPGWIACESDDDTSGGFSQSGKMRLHIPERVTRNVFEHIEAYWLRCVLTEQRLHSSYKTSPRVAAVRVEAWGATITARHGTTVVGEELGISDGTPGQRFRLRHTPVLERDQDQDYVVVIHDEQEQAWHEVTDFSSSRPEDLDYTLDSADGTITFGPALLQPDGTLQQYGATPPRGSRLRFRRYEHGGGTRGNIARGELTVLKAARPYISKVVNYRPASGGVNAEQVQDMAMRAPQYFRARHRVVTAEDYEFLACQVPGVARTFCYAPGNQGNGSTPGHRFPPPGTVRLLILPMIDDAGRFAAPDDVRPSPELLARVRARINPLRPLGIFVEYGAPTLLYVQIDASVRVPADVAQRGGDDIRRQCEAALYHYLSPYSGGSRGDGWPLGRPLRATELIGLLQPLIKDGYVETIQMALVTEPHAGTKQVVTSHLSLDPDAVVCSYRHTVHVRAW